MHKSPVQLSLAQDDYTENFMTGILVENISRSFGSFQAVNGINLESQSGSLIALLGPLGSRKSTLLRLIAGLETPDSGRIEM